VRPGGWSQTIRPFSLPYGMDVVLGDVCGGSNSPSMVSVACSGLCSTSAVGRKLFSGYSAGLLYAVEALLRAARRARCCALRPTTLLCYLCG
jgi:hypothetical protein